MLDVSTGKKIEIKRFYKHLHTYKRDFCIGLSLIENEKQLYFSSLIFCMIYKKLKLFEDFIVVRMVDICYINKNFDVYVVIYTTFI